MKKRTAIRVVSFCLAAAAVCAGYGYKMYKRSENYKLRLQNVYSKSLEDFTGGVNDISLTLSKAMYIKDPEQMSAMAAQLLTQAEASKTALSGLPQNGELTTLNRFLSQVGNYAMSVSKTLIGGGELGDEDTDNISALSSTAEKIAKIVSDASVTYNNSEYWAGMLEEKLDKSVGNETLDASLTKLEEELSGFPTLIYDGPFSDHILEKEPEMIKSAPEVSREDALKHAAEACEMKKGSLEFEQNCDGKIPCYRFSGDGITATVSKRGGYLVYMLKSRSVNDTVLSAEQAVEKAKRYLERRGITGFRETYYYTDSGICTVNFAHLDGETVCYTDLLKVSVAMDNGEIMSFESSGYLTNHKDRSFETPAYSSDDAMARVSKNLTVSGVSLALIPKNGNEVRCYEFECKAHDGKEVLVYINASTLKEEDILILLKSDNGILVK